VSTADRPGLKHADVGHANFTYLCASVVLRLPQLEAERPPVPKLAICIMIAGTRGDVQPFIALGIKLKVRHRGYRGMQSSWFFATGMRTR